MIFIANLVRIHFARSPQKICKIPRTDTTGGLVIQSGPDLILERAKFLCLLKNIRHGGLPKFFR
jgi:hypothetical protein